MALGPGTRLVRLEDIGHVEIGPLVPVHGRPVDDVKLVGEEGQEDEERPAEDDRQLDHQGLGQSQSDQDEEGRVEADPAGTALVHEARLLLLRLRGSAYFAFLHFVQITSRIKTTAPEKPWKNLCPSLPVIPPRQVPCLFLLTDEKTGKNWPISLL